MAAKVDWAQAFLVESQVAHIMSQQEKRGVWFNRQRAQWLIHRLNEMVLHIDLVAVPLMPKVMRVTNQFSKPFLKSGQPNTRLIKWMDETGIDRATIGGPFTGIAWDDFNLGSGDKVKDWLLDQGWVPDEWNTKDLTTNSKGQRLNQAQINENINGYIRDLQESKAGPHKVKLLGIRRGMTIGEVKAKLLKMKKLPSSPKITEESLETVETPVGALVKERVVWTHRRSLLQGLVEQVRPDGRLGAGANPDATPTHRMRHRVVVNIPAARSPFGREIRSLFAGGPVEGVSQRVDLLKHEGPIKLIPNTNRRLVLDKKGNLKAGGLNKRLYKRNRYVFVGYDGSGLELRMLAHYIGDPDFTREVVEGDVHTKNQVAAGLPTRDDAKTFIYAFIYGAGDAKIGWIIGGTSKDGAAIRAQFLAANPLLADLIDKTRAQAEQGFLIGLDGRKLMMRRNGATGEVMVHKALNTLLQAAGAVVMKYAMIYLDDEVKRLGLRAYKVIDMHDEGQWECHPDDVAKLKEVMSNCVKKAGEFLELKCPLASDAVHGNNWYDTH